MKGFVFKVRDLERWKKWCKCIQGNKDVIETLAKENVSMELSATFSMDGENYVIGMMESDGFSRDESEISRRHREEVAACLERCCELEMLYCIKDKSAS